MAKLKYQRPYKLLAELIDGFEDELLPALRDGFVIADGIKITDQMIADYEDGILASAVDGQMDEGEHEPIPAKDWKQCKVKNTKIKQDGYEVDLIQSSMTCHYGTSKGDTGVHFWSQVRITNSELQKLNNAPAAQVVSPHDTGKDSKQK